jgi:CheY-like chemotaxis protein
MLSSVFDLFTQVNHSLDRSQGGLGIGLTLVRRLVEMHGGSVHAFSEGVNRGSEFVIRLPLMIGAEARQPSPNGGPARLRGDRARRVLVVDDNEDACKSLARLLRLNGHEVRIAHDGPTTLALLPSFPAEAVLLDIGLPGMDGYQVARAIRGQPLGETMTLVALTGYGQDEDRRRSRDAGFDHHLVKPVDLDALSKLFASLPGHPEGSSLAST